jgi:TonB family protein
LLLDKLESGVLVMETKDGLVSVRPSVGQCIYLLWTFRNFRKLPIKLLNSRQQRLVERLYRSSATSLLHAPDRTILIGTVEDVALPLIPLAPAIDPHAAACDPPKKLEVPVDGGRKDRKPFFGALAWSKVWLTVGVGAWCGLVALAAWRQVEAKPSAHTASLLNVGQVETPRSGGGAVQSEVKQVAVEGAASTEHQRLLASEVRSAANTDTQSASGAEDVANPEHPAMSVPATIKHETVLPKAMTAEVPARPVGKSASVSEDRDSDSAKANDDHLLSAVPERKVPVEATPIEVSRPPRRVVYPDYPATNVQGKVTLQALIGSDGTVREVKVLSGNRVLAAAAVRAVRHWRYEPYYRDGQAVETETNVGISFISADVISMSFPSSVPVSR